MVVGQLTIAFGTSTRGFGSNWVLFWGGKVCRLIWSKSKWGGMCPPTSSILYKNWRVGVYPPLFRMNSGKNVGALFTTLSLVQAQQRCSSQGGPFSSWIYEGGTKKLLKHLGEKVQGFASKLPLWWYKDSLNSNGLLLGKEPKHGSPKKLGTHLNRFSST